MKIQLRYGGDGQQTRSYLYIDECIEATRRLMDSDFIGPVNIGSEEMVTINELVDIVESIEDKDLERIYVDGPLGVRGRNSNNDLIREKLGWDYSMTLEEGIKKHTIGLVGKLVKKCIQLYERCCIRFQWSNRSISNRIS